MATLSHSAAPSRAPARSRSSYWPVLGVVLLSAAALAIGWVGFIASDDVSYYLGAREWIERPPFAGGDHWTTRFPLILTLAGAMALLGDGLLPLAATAILWYTAFVAAGFILARRLGGPTAGMIAAALLATMPLAATFGSVVNCDLPEATFLILGVLLLADQRNSRRAFAAGLCFGAAILCRETAVLALAGLGPLFLLGRPLPRRSLLLAAGGAALVLGGEMLFQLALTGDPLHRYVLAFNHDSTIDRRLNLEGNLLAHPVLDPLLVLLANNEFGLLFWFAAAALVAKAHRHVPLDGRPALAIIAAMAVAALLLVAALSGKLVLNPRYFTIVAVAAALLVAVWLARMPARPRAILLGGIVATNLLMLSVQNAHPQWPAEALVIAARANPGTPVSADAAVLHRAKLPIAWNGIGNVVPAPNPNGLRLVKEADAPAGAAPLARYPSPPTRLGAVVLATGLDGAVPAPIRRRLLGPSEAAVLLPSEPAAR